MDVIRAIRNIRSEMDVPMGREANLYIVPKEGWEDIFVGGSIYFKKLAGIQEMTIEENADNIAKNTATAVTSKAQIFMPLEDLIDFDREKERLFAEKAKLEKEVSRAQAKLANDNFVQKAPANVVEGEREKEREYKSMLAKVLERIAEMEELMDQ